MSTGYEKQDASAKSLWIIATVSVTILVILVVIVNDVFVHTREQLVEEMVLSPESVALRELRASEQETLTSYAVVDAKAGIYQIPIERAMKLMAEEAYQSQMQK